jgi:2-polyprenyl-6-methoxyphenol hydroxylase-like FAD-dependent oxidoreductase
LRHLLLTGLDEHLHVGKRLSGTMCCHPVLCASWFADGTTATGDLLVGADGINSAVRRALTPSTTRTDTGVRCVIGRTR